jgi:hypothetical protein
MLMTDTFPSGFSTPLGATQDAGEPTGDVTSTLAELERKLRELERELTSIGRRRVRPEGEGAEPYAAQVPSAAKPAGLSATGRLVDERVEPRRTTAPAAPPPQRQMPPRPLQPPPVQPPPPQRQMVAPPEPPVTSTHERPRPTEAQLAALAELRRFSERLERFASELTADYDAVLARVMAVLSGRVPPEQAVPEPIAPEQAVPAPPAPAPAVSQEPLFEGRIELGVGPFYDIGSLSAFEQQVANMPNVSEVSVRRFEASHAVVDLRLAAPVALLEELRRVLDTDFAVRQVAPGRIALSFDEI